MRSATGRESKVGRRVLVIEDERDIARLIRLHLEDLCDEVAIAEDGTAGLSMALARRWDLVVLDLKLPGVDGLEICRALRSRENYTPILMVTSKSTEVDRVLGLETGADDYLTKPFSILELLARVKAIFRRVDAMTFQAPQIDQAIIENGDLTVHLDNRVVRLAEREVSLTAREFDLLAHFARNPGKVYTRAQLLDNVWGYGHEGYEHTVNSHINRLRGKIEQDPAQPTYILTVWGVGYRFREAGDAA